MIKTFQHSLYSMPSRLHFLVYPFKEIVRKEEESVCARARERMSGVGVGGRIGEV